MSYHLYGEKEPIKECPYCGSPMEADWVDVGVAMQQCGPYHCYACNASEIGPEQDRENFRATEEEIETGYYRGRMSPLANQMNGKPVKIKDAERLYKAGLGHLLKPMDDPYEKV